jgi:hypothetical protein
MDLGTQLPLWSAFPFIGILLSIALMPLLTPKFWHHHFDKVSLFWAPSLFGRDANCENHYKAGNKRCGEPEFFRAFLLNRKPKTRRDSQGTPGRAEPRACSKGLQSRRQSANV